MSNIQNIVSKMLKKREKTENNETEKSASDCDLDQNNVSDILKKQGDVSNSIIKGEEEDLDVDDEPTSVVADEELVNLMNEKEFCDFVAKMSYYDGVDSKNEFDQFLLHYYFNKKFLLAEIAVLGVDAIYSLATHQPSEHFASLFVAGNGAIMAGGLAGKLAKYVQSSMSIKRGLKYAVRSELLSEEIQDKVKTLLEEQKDENLNYVIKTPQDKSKDLNPYIR